MDGIAVRGLFPILVLFFVAALPLAGRGKDKLSYGEGLIVNVPLPESEVAQVVEDIAQNGIIRGTKEYNKDEFVSGAKAASSSTSVSRVERGWEGLLQGSRCKRSIPATSRTAAMSARWPCDTWCNRRGTRIRFCASTRFFRKTSAIPFINPDGSVESAEYKDIHEHLEAIEVMKKQTDEANRERQEHLQKKQDMADAEYLARPVDASTASQRSIPRPLRVMRIQPQNLRRRSASSSKARAGQNPVWPKSRRAR